MESKEPHVAIELQVADDPIKGCQNKLKIN